MDTLVAILQALGTFTVGLVARVGIVLAVMAALAAPGLLVIAAARAWRRLRHPAPHRAR